jgi:hypothetical protein
VSVWKTRRWRRRSERFPSLQRLRDRTDLLGFVGGTVNTVNIDSHAPACPLLIWRWHALAHSLQRPAQNLLSIHLCSFLVCMRLAHNACIQSDGPSEQNHSAINFNDRAVPFDFVKDAHDTMEKLYAEKITLSEGKKNWRDDVRLLALSSPLFSIP